MIINHRNIEASSAEEATATASSVIKRTSRVRQRTGRWLKDGGSSARHQPLRPIKKQPHCRSDDDCCDDEVSSASTAPTVSTASVSSSDSSCQDQENSIINKQQSSINMNKRTTPSTKKATKKASTTNRSQQQRRRRRKSSPKVIQIPTELTPEEKSQYVALDAEMVGVGPHGMHSRLARITLANYDGECIYDTLVQVLETVTDYRTHVSGITPQDLQEGGSAIPFEECRAAVQSMIQDKIVVGHGLKNDFRMLGLSHPWYYTRDTAKYEPFMKIDPTGEKEFIPKKLKVLVKDKLGLIIQEEGEPHCPLEDAVAALELYKKHRCKWEKAMMYKMERTKEIMKC